MLFALSAGMAAAVPARPLYEPEPMLKLQVIPNLAGTTWEGMLYLANSKITFNPDGTLVYGEHGSGSPGTWTFDGLNLHFQINQYSEYKTIVSGDIIQGVGINKAGQECKPVLHRIAAPGSPIPALPGIKAMGGIR